MLFSLIFISLKGYAYAGFFYLFNYLRLCICPVGLIIICLLVGLFICCLVDYVYSVQMKLHVTLFGNLT